MPEGTRAHTYIHAHCTQPHAHWPHTDPPDTRCARCMHHMQCGAHAPGSRILPILWSADWRLPVLTSSTPSISADPSSDCTQDRSPAVHALCSPAILNTSTLPSSRARPSSAHKCVIWPGEGGGHDGQSAGLLQLAVLADAQQQ